MKIYLAARYSRHKEMQEYRNKLHKLGHVITSRWIEGNHTAENDNVEKLQEFALDDWYDILAADLVISFTEKPREPSINRGGRHVEHGIALGAKKDIVVIGHRENVFHYLPGVKFFTSFDEFMEYLAP